MWYYSYIEYNNALNEYYNRLLVRGTCIEYNEEKYESIQPERKLSAPDFILYMGLLIGLLIIVISIIIINRINEKAHTRKKIVQSVEFEIPIYRQY